MHLYGNASITVGSFSVFFLFVFAVSFSERIDIPIDIQASFLGGDVQNAYF